MRNLAKRLALLRKNSERIESPARKPGVEAIRPVSHPASVTGGLAVHVLPIEMVTARGRGVVSLSTFKRRTKT